ncbi:hypothetical protein TNCV_56511 [Trichonephila clavipes]|nr:hypothetical protein TNCV_56511 [Trichonephila clavipes]
MEIPITLLSFPSGIVVSESDCGAVESGEYMDVCKGIVPFVAWSTLNSRRFANPFVSLVEGKRGGRLLTCSASKLGLKRAKSYCHLNGAHS